MCDYSLHAVTSRPAKVGDKLVASAFLHTTTVGLAEPAAPNVAVCLRPGTEVAFADGRVARFRQFEPERPAVHHDALEFADGKVVFITLLQLGEELTVLQLPAEKPPAQKIEDATERAAETV